MATKNFTADQNNWVPVCTGGCLIEVPRVCGRVFVTTAQLFNQIDDEAYHIIANSDCRTFSYSQSHTVYIKADEKNKDQTIKVTVTADNLAQ